MVNARVLCFKKNVSCGLSFLIALLVGPDLGVLGLLDLACDGGQQTWDPETRGVFWEAVVDHNGSFWFLLASAFVICGLFAAGCPVE
jgi:hypothetical protein